MNSAGIRGKTATGLLKNIETERKKKKFESLIELKNRVDKLGEISIVKIIDAWSQLIGYGHQRLRFSLNKSPIINFQV